MNRLGGYPFHLARISPFSTGPGYSKEFDQQPVWSIVCFFVHREYRNRGVTSVLLENGLVYAREKGADIVEAYPVEPKKSKSPDVFLYHGLYSSFIKAGFLEVARRSETRPLMRYYF